jgi:hypothetical protein
LGRGQAGLQVVGGAARDSWPGPCRGLANPAPVLLLTRAGHAKAKGGWRWELRRYGAKVCQQLFRAQQPQVGWAELLALEELPLFVSQNGH